MNCPSWSKDEGKYIFEQREPSITIFERIDKAKNAITSIALNKKVKDKELKDLQKIITMLDSLRDRVESRL